MKRLSAFLIALLLLASVPATAFAHDYVQMDRTDCSIEIILQYDGKNITGGTVTAVRVGYVHEDNGNYSFRRVGDDVPLKNVQSTDTLSALLSYYNEKKAELAFAEDTVNVKNGRAVFSGLTPGLYLIRQEKAADGFRKVNPFLVNVPYMIDGQYIYHVTAKNKTELETEPKPTAPPPTEPIPADTKLPQTGQTKWPIPLMTVSGLALFTLGWFLCFGRKREEHEK